MEEAYDFFMRFTAQIFCAVMWREHCYHVKQRILDVPECQLEVQLAWSLTCMIATTMYLKASVYWFKEKLWDLLYLLRVTEILACLNTFKNLLHSQRLCKVHAEAIVLVTWRAWIALKLWPVMKIHSLNFHKFSPRLLPKVQIGLNSLLAQDPHCLQPVGSTFNGWSSVIYNTTHYKPCFVWCCIDSVSGGMQKASSCAYNNKKDSRAGSRESTKTVRKHALLFRRQDNGRHCWTNESCCTLHQSWMIWALHAGRLS